MKPLMDYDAVDKSENFELLIEQLDTAFNYPDVIKYKKDIYADLSLSSGDTVLDVGCGLGHDARNFSKIVGKQGRVTGLDISRKFLQEAEKRSIDYSNINYTTGDVNSLSFPDNKFSCTFSERVFMHIKTPEPAVKEMIRVTQSGGRIAIVDTSMALCAVLPDYKGISKLISVQVVEETINPAPMYQIYDLFYKIGCEEVKVKGYVIIFTDFDLVNYFMDFKKRLNRLLAERKITSSDAKTFLDNLKTDSFIMCQTVFGVFGSKP